MNGFTISKYVNNVFFQCFFILFILIFVYWNGLFGGAPRADQIPYLHQIGGYHNLWDIIINSPSWNRVLNDGGHVASVSNDMVLYRPILYFQLGVFYYFFKYDFFAWQLASLVLHSFVVLGVYFLFRLGALKNTIFPFLFSLLFGCSYISSEMVFWSHISGYITFCLFCIFATIFMVYFTRSRKAFYGVVAVFLSFLSEFTYELGGVVSFFILIVFIYSFYHCNDNVIRKKILLLIMFSLMAILSYPILSIYDLYHRNIVINEVNPSNFGRDGTFSYLSKLTTYSFLEIKFWIESWFFPRLFDVFPYSRAGFSGFNKKDLFTGFSYITFIVFISSFFIFTRKFNFTSSFKKNNCLIIFFPIIFIFAYSLVISYGRALPRGVGIDYIYSNLYYSYIAILSVTILFSFVFLNLNYKKTIPIVSSGYGFFALSIIVIFYFNAFGVYSLGSSYRYEYSFNRINFIKYVDVYIRNFVKDGDYFYVDDKCMQNESLEWWVTQNFRRDSGWSGKVTLIDALFPEKSYSINKEMLKGKKVNVIPIKCPSVSVSSSIKGLGSSGLLLSSNPGWHAFVPVSYPQIINVDFLFKKKVKYVFLLPQLGFEDRSPHHVNIEFSNDKVNWVSSLDRNLNCSLNSKVWRKVDIMNEIKYQYMRIKILSNCGDERYLTLRGLLFQ